MFSCFGGTPSAGKREIGTITLMGIMHEQGGVPNQDYALDVTIGGDEKVWIACVFDGHGDDGHEISKIAATTAKAAFEKVIAAGEKDLGKIIEKVFKEANEAVDLSEFCRTSGCTGSMCIVRGMEMAAGNVGDSSIVLCSAKGAAYHPKWHSTDHRLDDDAEKARIVENGGIIYEDQYVVDKVEKNKGLMVTRTMGDVDMRPNGVICEPEITKKKLTEDDKYIVVASDGLWDEDGMSLQYACNVTFKHARKGPLAVSKALLKAVSADGPMDDCTIVTLSLN
ncbi:putative protein phosphatase 2C 2 [Porphyridium purpureum]|uniref:PPM-type phosphatase domain-containing protein n=1 Tax=Porphyridium purpureum TaxID=35688 RepID=A0A5J4YY38_PORPP|nr:putative protein phosphatase 2C 2 [Porphyridium purpureum]|eukprot:POR7296..scf208_2